MRGRLVVKKLMNWKFALAACGALLLLGAGVVAGAARFNKPKWIWSTWFR